MLKTLRTNLLKGNTQLLLIMILIYIGGYFGFQLLGSLVSDVAELANFPETILVLIIVVFAFTGAFALGMMGKR